MTHATGSEPTRLAVARRLYFYLIALVSFIAGLAALDNLLSVVVAAWLGSRGIYDINSTAYMRNAIAGSGGLLVVAAPIFLIHWHLIQRRQDADEERQSALRKFFLYVASAVAIGYGLTRGYDFLHGIVLLALGESLGASQIWPAAWLNLLLMIILSTLLQLYFHHVLVEDGDYGAETGRAGSLRRLYQTVAGLVGLGLIIYGSANLVETAWQALLQVSAASAGSGWWRSPLSDGITTLLLGSLLVRFNWQRWHSLTLRSAQEAQAALRRFYLYTAVVVGALATLAPTAQLLRELLLVLFDPAHADMGRLWDNLATPVSYIPIGLAIWVWHWRYLHQEAERYGESREGETIRRLYYYAIAATGLVLLWFGAANTVQALLEWIFGQEGTTVTAGIAALWVRPLANGLSLLAIGAPIWSYHWRVVQSVARRIDAAGLAERAAGPRKVYLYGAALAGALLILVYLARVVYRVLLLVLGDPNAALFSTATADEIARSLIAAALWVIHLWAIRTDTQMGAHVPQILAETDPAARRAALQTQIAHLEAELLAAKAELAEVDGSTPVT